MAMTLDEQINQALEVLRRGGIILYPTDTVWGIGCDATNPEAVGKIYALKKSENKRACWCCSTRSKRCRFISRRYRT
ncbi:MAG: L-threonylcarbamoyladenylate synthase [Alistipes indistinctus]